MAKHRPHGVAFKRQVVQEYLSGETLHGPAKRHDLSRNLIRIWLEKYEAGALDDDAQAADLLQEYEARIAALERLVGKQALELEFLKGARRPVHRQSLDAAIAHRNPPQGCIHHSDRGSQYAAERYRDRLRESGLLGSMGRRGNPYDNTMMESFMKTLKVEAVQPLAFEAQEDVADHLPRFIETYNARRLHSAPGYLSPDQYEKLNIRPPIKDAD